MNRFLFLLGVALAAALPASAQQFPAKPIHIVASYAAGGGVDLMARLVAKQLSQQLGQPIVVDNRAGASGSIGADVVAKSPPDGYTILAGGNPEITFLPHVNTRLPYDPQRDLAPLVLAANAPSVVVVNPSVKAHSMKDLLAQARESAGLPYATPGRGTPMHLAFELLNLEAGTKFIHVPYKGGGPATIDVVAGNIGMGVINAPPLMPHIAAGKLRAIAVMQGERSTLLPDVPTLREATGIDDISAPAWFAFFAPAGTPANVRRVLEQSIRQALADPEVRNRLIAAGLDVVAIPAAQFADIIRAESAYNARSVKRLGYRPE